MEDYLQFFKQKISHLFDAFVERRRLANQVIFEGDELVFKALGHLANSQLESRCHRQQLDQEIALQPLSHEQVQLAYQHYLMGKTLETDVLEASLRYFKGCELEKELFLQRCWRMIWADRHLGTREYQLVHLFGFWFGWERARIEKVGIPYRPVFLSQEHQQALVLLEVLVDSPNTFIKQQYKRQLARYHPDKVIGSGGSDEAINQATIMTIKIHEAYALIRMMHGF